MATSPRCSTSSSRLFALAHRDGSDVFDMRAEALKEGADRRHDDRGRVLGVAHPPQHPQALAHRLHRGGDPFEGQCLPRGEQLDVVRMDELAQIVDEALGRRRGRHGDHERTPVGAPGEGGDHQGPGRFRHRQGGAGAPGNPREGGLVAKQRRQRRQAHDGPRVPVVRSR
jgi:hypothetical protein